MLSTASVCLLTGLLETKTRLSATVRFLLLHRVSAWNSLPDAVRNSAVSALSEDAFAKLLKTYLMNCMEAEAPLTLNWRH